MKLQQLTADTIKHKQIWLLWALRLKKKKNLIYCLLEAHQKLFKGLFAHVDCGNLGKAEVYSLC